ncbi:zinc metalloprotease [Naasia sp. SYSU D00948]|uniref:zinc metalloprotease n=1 Tax=Naasia sp. SYSU D00948 TaxID=2817379 RepID=UPI001B301B0A|nr:zinc metalloprotease [Naasia sp. SYSU D00948]
MARHSFPAIRHAALAVVLATILAPAVVAPAAAAPPPTVSSTTAECAEEAMSTAGVSADGQGEDPNDVSRERVESVEALLAGAAQQAILRLLSRLGDLDHLRVTVPVHVHVITRDDGSGAPSQDRLDAQLEVLNSAFAGQASAASSATVFRFAVHSIDYTANSDWYDWFLFGDTDDAEAKTALHRGGPGELDLYITGLQDALGYATFPFDNAGPLDGVVISAETLPGGGQDLYNLGDRLVHEVGHWLGLFHTFENGCESPGDGVPDTPYQHDGDNIVSCSEFEDTCPAPGLDPVHNFMSYGDDHCIDRFTPGQSVRMLLAWFAFRGASSHLGPLLPMGTLGW